MQCTDQLTSSGHYSQIRNFQDPSIANAVPIAELIDSIQSRAIDWSNINKDAYSYEATLSCEG